MPRKLPPQSGAYNASANPPVSFRQSTDERFLFEEYEFTNAAFGPGLAFKWDSIPGYGIQHPIRPGYRLVRINLSDTAGRHTWIWSKEGNHEDEANFITSYSAESNAHPIYRREYVVLREDYIGTAVATKAQPLKSVIGLVRTAGGASKLKDGVHDLVFSNETGTGVAGKFQTIKGVITAQWLTNCGTGYTTAPTVTAPGVDEAVITAVIQSQDALLVFEEAVPAPGELGTVFLNVTRIYETLPGPVISGPRYNERGELETVSQRRQLAGTGPEADGLLVISSGVSPVNSVVELRETVTVPSRATLTDKFFDRERAHGQEVTGEETIVAPNTALTDPTYLSHVLSDEIKVSTVTKAKRLKISLKTGKFHPTVIDSHIDEATGIIVDSFTTFVPAGAKGGIGNVATVTLGAAGTSALGTGYFFLTFSGACVTPAIAVATVTAGVVTAVELLFGGSGYSTAPTALLSGSTATFTVTRSNGYVEVTKYDKWRSLAITSVLRDGTGSLPTSIPVDTRYPITLRESFPNVLKDVQLLEINGTLTQASWNLIEGYSGPVYGRITVKFLTDEQYQNWASVDAGTIFVRRPTIVQFFPQANRIAVEVLGVTVYTRDYPNSLHDEYVLDIPGISLTATLPATKPIDLPYDQWIVRSVKEEQWRFGLWRVEVEEILVPPDPQV